MGCVQAMSLLLLLLLLLLVLGSDAKQRCSPAIRRATFRSPPFRLEAGEVQDRFHPMEFISGDVGLKNFMGEVVDELDNPVPLTDVYLHHWAVYKYLVNSSQQIPSEGSPHRSWILVPGNQGVCPLMVHFFGFGAETRHSNYSIPGAYAIRVGDPKTIPSGYREVWYVNLHAIRTAGTADPLRCSECLCDLYNVTKDKFGVPLDEEPGYIGGLRCCYDGTRCRLKAEGETGSSKTFRFKYTIEYVDWDDNCVSPVRNYVFDATGDGKSCKIEHDIAQCSNPESGECTSVLEKELRVPEGGAVVFGIAHQHSGGQGFSVHGEDGRHICTSLPRYGTGSEPGNEAGFVVGMGSCRPGSTLINSKEKLRFTSNYSSLVQHTGVMSIFQILVANESALQSKSNQDNSGYLIEAVIVGIAMVTVVLYIAASKNRRHDDSDYDRL